MTQIKTKQTKPYWCKSKTLCGWWQTDIIGVCSLCPDCKPKERKLDEWIKPFMDSVNERFKQ